MLAELITTVPLQVPLHDVNSHIAIFTKSITLSNTGGIYVLISSGPLLTTLSDCHIFKVLGFDVIFTAYFFKHKEISDDQFLTEA